LGWTIEYDPKAIRDLNKLNRSIRLEIFRYMQERIAQADTPRNFGKPLRYDKFGLWRYRVRDFRIVCELQEARQVVLVVGVGHRKNVYK
jgi:mRNA interferase RelE/StbE